MSQNNAFIVAAMGASGSGKSAFIKSCLEAASPPRLLIWDTMDEYSGFASKVGSLRAMVGAVKRGGAFALRYVPSGTPDDLAARFDVFCSVAYVLGDLVLVVEELQTVTKPAWAPSGWSNCTLRGRHRGLRIFGVSQRPASVDKNFFSNATMVRCGRLNYSEDIRTMDGILGLSAARPAVIAEDQSVASVAALKPLEYVQRDMATGDISGGVLTFGQKAAKKDPKKKKK